MKFKQRLQKFYNKSKEHLWRIVLASVAMLAVVLIAPPLVSLIRTRIAIGKLNREKAAYEAQIARDSLLINNLKNDEFLEQYARETYYMQRPNEQVFIVE